MNSSAAAELQKPPHFLAKLLVLLRSPQTLYAAQGFADTVLSGGRQFLALLLVSRFLSVAEFSAFAVLNAISVYTLQFSVYAFKMPFLVYVGNRFNTAIEEYANSVRMLDVLTTGLLSTILVLIIPSRQPLPWMVVLVGFPLMCSATALFEFQRRVCYATNNVTRALIGSTVGAFCVFSLLLIVAWRHQTSITSTLLCQAIGALAGAATAWSGSGSGPRISWRTVARLHWPYSTWELLGGAAVWSGTYGLIVFWTKALTDAEIGAYRLAFTLAGLVVLPLNVAENSLTTRVAMEVQNSADQFLNYIAGLRKLSYKIIPPYFVIVSLGCLVAVQLFIRDRYPAALWMLPLILAFVFFSLAAALGNIMLRATTNTRLVFIAELSRAAVATSICYWGSRTHLSILFVSALPAGALAFLITQQILLRRLHLGKSL